MFVLNSINSSNCIHLFFFLLVIYQSLLIVREVLLLLHVLQICFYFILLVMSFLGHESISFHIIAFIILLLFLFCYV